MNEEYTYREVARTAPRPAEVWAAFRGAGGIGFYDDVNVVIEPGGSGSGSGGGARGLVATVRPTSATPLEPGGVIAMRWFEIAAADWDEFLALSVEAWPEFESTNDATIEGFFRTTDGKDPTSAEVLLVTRYPSLAGWESSRTSIRPDNVAGRNFLRRRELTRRSVVRTAGSFWTA